MAKQFRGYEETRGEWGGGSLRDQLRAARLRGMRSPEGHEPQGGGQGDGGQGDGSAGGEGGGEPPGDPSNPAGDPEGGGSAPEGGAHDPITPERLTSVLDARQRKQEAAFKKVTDQQAATQAALDEIRQSLSAMVKPKDPASDPPKGEPKESEDVVRLRRKVDELEARGKADAERAEAEATRRKDYQFQTDVKTALTKAGCVDPDAGFLVIKPKLSQSEDGAKIYATVESGYGEEDLSLEEYITREFSEGVAPFLFRGKVRQGGPAGGDSGGGGGGGYDFTKEQLLDNPELYAKDPERARAALEGGRVKGVQRPGQALSSFVAPRPAKDQQRQQ